VFFLLEFCIQELAAESTSLVVRRGGFPSTTGGNYRLKLPIPSTTQERDNSRGDNALFNFTSNNISREDFRFFFSNRISGSLLIPRLSGGELYRHYTYTHINIQVLAKASRTSTTYLWRI
jgi:hypothetical protein